MEKRTNSTSAGIRTLNYPARTIRENDEDLTQNIRLPSRDLNLVSPDNEAEMLPTTARCLREEMMFYQRKTVCVSPHSE